MGRAKIGLTVGNQQVCKKASHRTKTFFHICCQKGILCSMMDFAVKRPALIKILMTGAVCVI